MKKREYFETFLCAIAAIVMASIGIQFSEGCGRIIFCILTIGTVIVTAYLLNCYIEKIETERQSNTKKGEG